MINISLYLNGPCDVETINSTHKYMWLKSYY